MSGSHRASRHDHPPSSGQSDILPEVQAARAARRPVQREENEAGKAMTMHARRAHRPADKRP